LDWFVGKEGSAMDITKGQKILVASYLAYIVLFYALLILEVEPVIKYADTIELVGFVLTIILMSVGIKKHSPERRLAWKLFLAAIVAYGIGDLIWAYYVTFLGVDPNSAPSICDAFYLVNTIIYCAGLVVYLKQVPTISFMAISFDMIISVFAAAGLMYNFMIVPILESPAVDYLQIFLQLLYATVDFSLMVGILILIFGVDDRIIFNRENIFLAASFLITFILDEISIFETLYAVDFGNMVSPMWSLSCFLMGIASLYPSKVEIPSTRFFNFTSRIERTLLYSRTLIPYFFTFTLLILIGAKYDLFDPIFLWAIFLVTIISIRQILVIERNKKLLRTIRSNEEKLNLQNLELQRLNQQILHDAEVDFLTQLSNRRYIDKTFERLTPPEGRAESLGILLIDVDFFKRINDTYGHPAGDFVLRTIADKIKSVIRGGDVAGRFGGDEFIILLPESDLPIVKSVAEQLTKIVREDEKLSAMKVTLSIGGTSQRVDHQNYDVQLLLKQADESLYMAKEGGRNRFVVM